MENKKTRLNLSLVAALMFFMVGSAGTYENPALQVIIEHWSKLNVSVSTIRLMSTIQSFVGLPLILLIGAIVGKKISYKKTAILASLCVVAGGLGPFIFSGNWTVILIFRALIGVGVGLAASRTPLLLSSVPADEQPRFMGLAQAVSVCVGLISGPIVGMLSNISWRHTFLINLYTIPVFIMMFFIREPERPQSAAGSGASAGEKSALNPKVFLYALIQMLSTAITYPAIMGISTYLAGHKIGSATMAGTILILYSLGCVAVSSLGAVQKIFKRFTMSFCFVLLTAAYVLLILVPSVPTAFVALFLVGFGFMGEFSLIQVYCGGCVRPDRVPMATSLLLTGNQIGVFISAFIMTLSHSVFHLTTDADSTFALGAILYIAFALLSSLRGLLVPYTEEQSAKEAEAVFGN